MYIRYNSVNPKSENRVVNTRNPFSRIQSGWNDKYNMLKQYEEHKEQYERYWNVTDKAEKDNFERTEGIHNSFRAFLRLVLYSPSYSMSHTYTNRCQKSPMSTF